jgi:hypothetical protein
MKKHAIALIVLLCLLSPIYSTEVKDYGYTQWVRYTQREKELIVFGYLNAAMAINIYIKDRYYNANVDLEAYLHRGETVREIVAFVDQVYLFNTHLPLYMIITWYIGYV